MPLLKGLFLVKHASYSFSLVQLCASLGDALSEQGHALRTTGRLTQIWIILTRFFHP